MRTAAVLFIAALLFVAACGKENKQVVLPAPSPASSGTGTGANKVPGACPMGKKIVDGILVWNAVTMDDHGNPVPPPNYSITCNDSTGIPIIADAGPSTSYPVAGLIAVGPFSCSIQTYGMKAATSGPSQTQTGEKTSAGLMCI